MYANYLMWQLGYLQGSAGKNALLQTVFYGQKLLKLYFLLMLLKALVSGGIELINRHIEEQTCLSKGKVWRWFDQTGNYTCSVCGNLSVFYRDIFTLENCFIDFIRTPKKIEELLSFLRRFEIHPIDDFGGLNFGSQAHLNEHDYARFLQALAKNSLVEIDKYSIDTVCFVSEQKIKSIARFIQVYSNYGYLMTGITIDGLNWNFKYKNAVSIAPIIDAINSGFTLTHSYVAQDIACALAKQIAKGAIGPLDLRGTNIFSNKKCALEFFNSLSAKNNSLIDLSFTPEHYFNETLPLFGGEFCELLAKFISQPDRSSLTISSFSSSYSPSISFSHLFLVSEDCFIELMHAIPAFADIGDTFYIDIDSEPLTERSIIALAGLPELDIGGLSLNINLDKMTDALMLTLIKAASRFNVGYLEVSAYASNSSLTCLFNATLVTSALLSMLNSTGIDSLSWRGFGPCLRSAISVLLDQAYLLRNVSGLDLSNNGIQAEEIVPFFNVLNETGISGLNLANNRLGSKQLFKIPLETRGGLYELDLGNNAILDGDITDILKSDFDLFIFGLKGNNITDKGVRAFSRAWPSFSP